MKRISCYEMPAIEFTINHKKFGCTEGKGPWGASERGTRGTRFRDGDKLTCFTFQSNKVLEHEIPFREEGNVAMFRPKLTQITSDYMTYVIANAPESLSDATRTCTQCAN